MINTQRPISAYSMSDFENLNSAEFKRGKDKQKRKSRKGMIAAGVGAAAGIGAGVRYGGAEMKARKAASQYSTPALKESILKTGAKGQLSKDIDSIKSMPGRIGDSAKRAWSAAGTKTGVGNTNKGLIKEAGSRIGNVFKSGKAGKAAVIGAGLAGAGAVAGGGYAAYKAMKNRKKK
jgi:hypothetical protein